MIIVAQIKLVPDSMQFDLLMETLTAMNRACNQISAVAFDNQCFNRTKLHKLTYYPVREDFGLKSQMTIRAIGKVVDAYKVKAQKAKGPIDTQRIFRLKGAVAFDCRMVSFDLSSDSVSILTLEGRQLMKFEVGDNARNMLAFQKGESDLFFRNGHFFLNVSCDIPEPELIEHQNVIGVDLGINQLATLSTGESFDGQQTEKVHKKNQAKRTGLQKKKTRSAKRKLKRNSGKEKRFKRNENHIISKRIVDEAKRTGSAIALEDLTGIRRRQRVRKSQRSRFSGWAFHQLRQFIIYKAKLAGVPVFLVPPAYTSQRCHKCGHIEKANRKSQSEFVCCSCGHGDHADKNAALNIAELGCSQSAHGRVVGFIRQ